MIDSRPRATTGDIEVEHMYAQVRRSLFGKRDTPVVVGRYEILERIGAGAMGFVYAGRDVQLQRQVAIKLLRPEASAAGRGSKGRARLLREAQAMAQVSSPFAVTVFEAGTHGDQVFVAMEYVPGRTLTQWLGDEPKDWREVCELFARAGRGLAAVHDAGLVHRDFKPDNVLIGDDGRPRVADFGLAAAVGHREPASDSMIAPPTNVRITRTGAAAGSLAYMSPEQHRRESVDARSDQFGFCVALFEALHGARPFEGATEDALRPHVLAGTIAWPKGGPRLPRRVLRLVERGLDPEPSRRFASMHAVVRELERALHRPRAWGLAAAAATGGALWAVFAGGWSEHEPTACEQRSEAQSAAWNETRREAVRSALAGTDEAYAAATAAQVTARLDAYSDAWHVALDRTCAAEAPSASEPEMLTLACLDRGLGEMRSLVDALVDEPQRLVGHATLAALKLRDPALCHEEPSAALRTTGAASPEAAAARGQIWSALADASVRLNAGDYAGGLARARLAVTDARGSGDESLLAEALFLRGTLTSHLRRHEDAERDLFDAAVIAERVGHAEILARARTELVIVVGYRQGRADEAAVWSSLAGAALAQHGRGGVLEVRLLNARGLVERKQGDAHAARVHFENALELAGDVLAEDHPGLASTLENLAYLDAAAGDNIAARTHLRQALTIRLAALGERHPDTQRTRTAIDELR